MKSSMRKLLTFLFAALLFQVTPALAWVGGPWGNNSHEGDAADGVYSAVLQMRNGLGIARWSQLSGIPEVSRYSESVVWYRGAVYFGVTYGLVDTVTKKVTGMTEGEITGVQNDANGVKGNGPLGFCNTEWSGKVRNVKRAYYFTAKGSAAFYGDYSDEFLPSTTIEETRTDTGPPDPNTGLPIFTTTTVTTTTIPGSGGPNAAFPDFRTQTKVFVWGNRTSPVGLPYPTATGLSRAGVGFDIGAAGGGGGGGGG